MSEAPDQRAPTPVLDYHSPLREIDLSQGRHPGWGGLVSIACFLSGSGLPALVANVSGAELWIWWVLAVALPALFAYGMWSAWRPMIDDSGRRRHRTWRARAADLGFFLNLLAFLGSVTCVGVMFFR
jgi:hypothetical protein